MKLDTEEGPDSDKELDKNDPDDLEYLDAPIHLHLRENCEHRRNGRKR
jgi:hypothetical protein